MTRNPRRPDFQGMLWRHAAPIQDPVLKEFLTNILLDAKIMHPFYMARASQGFHHNEKGGLFNHSVQVALAAIEIAQNYGLEQPEVDCVFDCGLLHDIGKIMKLYNIDKNQQKASVGSMKTLALWFMLSILSA